MRTVVLLLWLLVSAGFTSMTAPSLHGPNAIFAVPAIFVLLFAAHVEGKNWRTPAPFFIVGTTGAAWLVFIAWTTWIPWHAWSGSARRQWTDDLLVCLPWFLAAVACGFVCRLIARHSVRHTSADPDTAHCHACGYSLRGLRERRCPECGVPFDHPPLGA